MACVLLPTVTAAPMFPVRDCLPAGPRVALTFDDGPYANKTCPVLAILAREAAPSTFFVVGQRVRQDAQVLRDTAAAGHEIALHSDTHANLTHLSAQGAAGQMRRVLAAVDAALNGRGVVRFWRAPYGAIPGVASRRAIVDAIPGVKHMLWSHDTQDWRKPGREGFLSVFRRAGDGAVILMHEHTAATQAWLIDGIEILRQRNTVFVRLSEMQLPVCTAPSEVPGEQPVSTPNDMMPEPADVQDGMLPTTTHPPPEAPAIGQTPLTGEPLR